MTGVIQRTTKFQFCPRLTGITGWTFRMFCVRSLGPTLKFQFSWTGTLMRLAIGFCAALRSFSAFSASEAGVASWVGGLSGDAAGVPASDADEADGPAA